MKQKKRSAPWDQLRGSVDRLSRLAMLVVLIVDVFVYVNNRDMAIRWLTVGLFVAGLAWLARSHRWLRWILVFGMLTSVSVLVFTNRGVLGQWAPYQSDPIKIVIVDLAGEQREHYQMGPQIYDLLQQGLRDGHGGEQNVELVREPIDPSEGKEKARALGRDRHAAVVIWGWYGTTKDSPIKLHVEILTPAHPLQSFDRTRHVSRDDLESTELYVSLSNDLTHQVLGILGLAQAVNGDSDSAILLITSALQQQVASDARIDERMLYWFRAGAYAQRGDYVNANADYTHFLEIRDDDKGRVNRANTYLQLGRIDLALVDADRAIELEPDDGTAYGVRASVQARMGNFEGAIADHNREISMTPHEAFAYHSRGTTFYNHGLAQQAIADYEKATQLRPIAEFYAHLADAYLAELDQAMRSEDRRPEGRLYLSAAESSINQAIKLHPDVADFYYLRAKIHQLGGDWVSATVDYTHAKERWDKSAVSPVLFARDKSHFYLANEGIEVQAEQELRQYRTLINRSYAYCVMRRPDPAIADLTEADHMRPDGYAVLSRGVVYLVYGDEAAARTDLKTVVEHGSRMAREQALSYLDMLDNGRNLRYAGLFSTVESRTEQCYPLH